MEKGYTKREIYKYLSLSNNFNFSRMILYFGENLQGIILIIWVNCFEGLIEILMLFVIKCHETPVQVMTLPAVIC